jgi:hypothetical protein
VTVLLLLLVLLSFPGTAAVAYSISGIVFEDADYAGTASEYDGGIGDTPLPDVDVELYAAADSSFVATTATNGSGLYTFLGLSDGNYFVRVRSASVGDGNSPPAAGHRLPCLVGEPAPGNECALAELTWANGDSLYGGQDPLVDDGIDVNDGGVGDTHVPVTVSGGDVSDVNFGFSFNLIVNTNDTGQGSLRHYLMNADWINGTNGSYFKIPTSDPNYDVTGNKEYKIILATELPTVRDSIQLDGTTQPGFGSTPIIEIDGGSIFSAVNGLTLKAGNSTVRGLVINNFWSNGIEIDSLGTNEIYGNFLGTDVAGLATASNWGDGIRVRTGGNTIGGAGADRNVISGNWGAGVYLSGTSATGNMIYNNYIGTDKTGLVGLGNGNRGIGIVSQAASNTIGGPGGNGNVVAGNTGAGITIQTAGSSSNVIQSNFIGVGTDGATAIPNTADGIMINSDATSNEIGGTGAGEGNVISGNDSQGVEINGPATSGNTVVGNLIGTDQAGTSSVPNAAGGVRLSGLAAGNTIGGTSGTARNVISGNDAYGIEITESASADTIAGNYIGVDITGIAALFNGGEGIRVLNGANGNTIGGRTNGAGNIIAFNSLDGIMLDGDTTDQNTISRNAIFENDSLGIDLANDGVTPNDPTDGDPGPADLLNFPEITSATESGGTIDVDFDLDLLSGYYRIEFFKNPSGADPTGYGEGEVFADSVVISHGGTGVESFSHSFVGSTGDTLTATCTECLDGVACSSLGSTSEFSGAVGVAAAATYSISGIVFEDADFAGAASDWDNGVGDAALDSVDVELYDSGGSFVASVLTATDGTYTFTSVVADTYKVRVRSATIGDSNTPPASGFNASCIVTDPPSGPPCALAELTWADGDSLYGGQDPLVDDTDTDNDDGPGDTYVAVPVLGADVTDVNFGFSYKVIVNTNDDGQGSFRTFLENAAANVGTNSTYFKIPTTDPGYTAVPLRWTITPLSPFNPIADPVVIDGATQPGFTGSPVIYLDGASAGAGVDAFTLANDSDGSTIRSMIVNRFTRDGILVQAGADSITIAGCWIGSDGTGSTLLGNGDDGIELYGAYVTVGGTGPFDRNVINNSGDEGINITGASATGNVIIGNYIGLESDGSGGSGNGDVGIAILPGATANTIGGLSAAERNVISMNLEGIEINTADNVVIGNYIGTDATGALDRGNRSDDGVEIQAGSGNRIGGKETGAGNLIAFSNRHGVVVKGGTANSVLGNRIHSNDLLGIDLGNNGVTANDAGDGDGGPNDLLNFPEITSATEFGGTVDVDFDLDVPAGSYRIEFFKNPSGADTSGYGEGEVFADSVVVSHGGTGVESFSHSFAGSTGDTLTATCTECLDGVACSSLGSTSEFSGAVGVAAAATYSISGTVFEDVNYGGGVGRDYATALADAGGSFTIERDSVTVELYDDAGSYLGSDTTAADGSYGFVELSPALYTVRVVNGTVTSTRTGSDSTELGAQTYRIDGDGEGLGTGATKVGGEVPSNEDAATNSGAQALAELQGTDVDADGIIEWTQSIVTVDASGGDVSGADFGFNFDTIVNTNEKDQGSLRQFILNANLLTDEALLDQDDALVALPAEFEHSIFMIPVSDPGFGPAIDGGAGNAFIINPASQLPIIIDSNTAIDVRTETAFVGDTNGAVNEPPTGPVGTPTTGPEVIVDYQLLFIDAPGLQIQAANTVVDGLGMRGVGGTTNRGSGFRFENGSTGSVIRNCTSWWNDSYGIRVANTDSVTVSDNVSRHNGSANHRTADGVIMDGSSDITVRDNTFAGNIGDGIDAWGAGHFIQGNLLKGNGATVKGASGANGSGIRAHGAGAGNMTITSNEITTNRLPGVLVQDNTTTGISITQNKIYENTELGIDLEGGSEDGFGVTANDGGDGDGGPNSLLNFPVITSATESGGTVTVRFDLDLQAGDYRVEFFVNPSGTDPSGNGEGEAFTGSVDISHTGSGLESFVHTFAGAVGDTLTATTTECANPGCTAYGSTSEFSASVVVSAAVSITGVVFEDVNYGGGVGRDYATALADAGGSFTIERDSVVVELYDASSDTLVAVDTTGVDGSYSFLDLSHALYIVRVVNGTVTSARSGSDGTELGVQTFRIDGDGEAVGDGAKKVGGERPSNEDAAANSGAQTLPWLQGTDVDGDGIVEWTQSIVTVDSSAGDVAGVDFGFNFDTVVNTNDKDQGSLRQFILNANLLTDQAALDQDDALTVLPSAIEHSIFMMPPPGDPLGRPADGGYTGTPPDGGIGSAFVITPASAMEPLTDDSTSVNGGVQTSYSGDTSASVAEVTTGPEVILDYQGTVSGPGFEISGTDVVIKGVGVGSVNDSGGATGRGISLSATGTTIQSVTSWNNDHDGVRVDACSGFQIFDSVSRDNGQSNTSNDGIQISSASANGTVRNNQLIDNNGYGIDINFGSNNMLVELNLVKGNGFGGTGQNAGIGFERAPAGSTCTVRQNTITGSSGAGIVVDGNFTAVKITENSIFSNGGIGIDLAPGTTVSGDGVTGNDSDDSDTGGNNLQNFPVLAKVVVAGGNTTIDGSVTSAANTTYELEFFHSSAPDPTGYGEGETFIGTAPVTTDGTGNVSFSETFPTAVPDGYVVSATATDPSGNTSEFSDTTGVETLAIVKKAFYTDGTPVPNNETIPSGTKVKYLLYVNNPGGPVNDMSVQDVLDSTFVFVPNSLRFDNTIDNCSQLDCSAAEEDSIFSAVESGTQGTDGVDGDVVSFGADIIDAGDENAGNAQLDIQGSRIWALIFTVKME